MLSRLLHDLRHAWRTLGAKPGFAFAAILTLALGIGANTLVFSLIDAVYLNDLPYRDADRLVDLYASSSKFGGGVDSVSIPDYVDLHAGVPALADSALYADASFNLVDGGAPERLRGVRATASLFSTLGVGAALGRTFDANDAQPGRERVVLLSDALWRNRFNADARVLDRSLRLDGESYRVIGVLPPGFMFPRADAGLFVPFAFTPAQLAEDQRGVNYSAIVARLAPGASLAQVQAQAAAVVARNVERSGASGGDGSYADWVRDTGLTFGARPLREQLSGRNAGELLLLQAAVVLVLLIALANAGNLILARLSARRGELAVRSALGARRSDVARQLCAETGVLAVAAALLGAAGAWFGIRLLGGSGLLPAWAHFGLDARTLAFVGALTALTVLAAGLAPALIGTRAAPQTALRDGARSAGAGRDANRVRAGLVVLQLALAVALLASAGLLLRSFANAVRQDSGFAADGVLSAHLVLPPAKYPDDAARARMLRNVLDGLRALPGGAQVGATTRLPFSGENGGIVFRIEGQSGGELPHAALRSVDEGFFVTLGIPLLRGRTFDAADWTAPAKSVVVDATFARRYFPHDDALGHRLTLGSDGTGDAFTIIGVVGDVKHADLTAPNGRPTFYFDLGALPGDSVFVAVRAGDASPALADAMRAAVRKVDAEQPLFDIDTLAQRIDRSLTGRRVPLELIGLFALCALVLAAVGIYSVLAFGVAQRTGEIGLRMAIGADARRVRRDVLAGGTRLIGAGLALGVVGAAAAGFALQSRLFQVSPIDPASLAAVVAVLALVALAACWLPARRAARLDPLVALRHT